MSKQHHIGSKEILSDAPAFREVLEQISNTKEMRQLAGNLLPELIRLWAVSGTGAGPARSVFRKGVASAAGNSIKNAMLDEKGLDEAPALHSLASDEAFTSRASAHTGLLLNGLLSLLVNGAEEIRKLDVAAKKRLVETIVRDLSTGKSAELLTVFCRTINDVHKNEPDFLSRALAPAFEKWITSLDFGEVKEALETGIPSISAVVHMINTTMWHYPGKVISFLALVPSLGNIAVDALAQAVGMFNEKGSPDLVADVILSVLRETDADTVGRLVNELAEMVRRFHVGSALIGEPGAPQLPNDVSVLLESVFSTINGEVFWKSRTAVAEIKEQAGRALTNVLADHPELLAGSLSTKSAVHNARFRTLGHRLETLESLDTEKINEALAQSLAGLDLQEGANIINATVLLANRMFEDRPEVLRDKITSLMDALDTYEVSAFLENAGEIVGEALRPLARAMVPPLTKGFIKALAVDDDEFEDAAESARHMLAALLLKNGEAEQHD